MRKNSKKLSKLLPFLKVLNDINGQNRTILLSHINSESCSDLCETISNVLKNPSMGESERKRLRKMLSPHKQCLRSLVKKNQSVKQKQKKLQKIGGSPLGVILSSAIPLLLDILVKR